MMTERDYKPYTGIGSRAAVDVPQLLPWLSNIASWLDDQGYTLRTGGAEGCDQAFMRGTGFNREVFLPWPGFNGIRGGTPFDIAGAEVLAARFHPGWSRLPQGARKLHTRNVPQVLGSNLASPSLFVLCWTPDGLDSGGTGQAIRIARAHGVPVYNLYHRDEYTRFVQNTC